MNTNNSNKKETYTLSPDLQKHFNTIVSRIRSISKSQKHNLINGQRGVVRSDRIVHRFSKEPNKKIPIHEGFMKINVCSSTDLKEFKGLSPFILGPVDHGDPYYPTAQNFENFYQWLKVFQQDVNGFGYPSAKYLKKRVEWFCKPTARKRNNRSRQDFLYFHFRGKRFNYLEGRKELYCGAYADLVVKTDSYKRLVNLIDEGKNIQILGYDGIDYHSDEDPKGTILYKHLMNPDRSFGHEMVLVGLLTNQKVWEW